MTDDEQTTIIDEYGELIQRQNTRGGWTNVKRILKAKDGTEYTVRLEPRRVQTKDYINALLGSDVHLKLNEMNSRIEVNGEALSDHREAKIINRLHDLGLKGESRMRGAILEAAHTNRYHPIRDYLRSLTWDGRDHITKFIGHMEAGEQTGAMLPIYIRKWLVGAVAKVMEAGQNFMLVFDGVQGCGKSYLVRWLCPKELQRGYFIEGAIQPDDKDSYIRLMGSWIWEVGELQATTRRADMEALKDFISRRDVTVRVPYARYDTTKPAAASFIGTINESGSGFLGDMTGTRRFAICDLAGIDWDYAKLDVNQVWAQAMALYLEGEAWELNRGEREQQEAINHEYEMPSTVGELFYRFFDVEPQAEQEGEFVPSSEIIAELKLRGLEHGRDRAHYMELSAIMRRENATRAKVGNVNGYYGVKVKSQVEIATSKNGSIPL